MARAALAASRTELRAAMASLVVVVVLRLIAAPEPLPAAMEESLVEAGPLPAHQPGLLSRVPAECLEVVVAVLQVARLQVQQVVEEALRLVAVERHAAVVALPPAALAVRVLSFTRGCTDDQICTACRC